MSSYRARRSTSYASRTLARYLDEIAAYPLLSREQEAALSRGILAGDRDAVHRLVCSNLRFVVSIAKQYRHAGIPLADLIGEGNLGLLRAAARYDHSKGVKFISYAVWWIRQAIFIALAENAHTMRVPLHRAGSIYRLGRRANALRHELGREPTRRELADELEVSARELEATLPVTRVAISLDAPTTDDGELNLVDTLAADSDAMPDAAVIDAALKDAVRTAVTKLRPREAQVIGLYFGFDGGEPLTLEDIGRMLGVTRERARQIKEAALEHIRHSRAASLLAPFAVS